MGLCCASLCHEFDDLPLSGNTGREVDAYIQDVYDGDTCTIVYTVGCCTPRVSKFRLWGCDTPETKLPVKPPSWFKDMMVEGDEEAPTLDEQWETYRELGKRAARYVRTHVIELIHQRQVRIRFVGAEKYGRDLGLIEVDGISVNWYIIHNKLGKIYNGGTKENFTPDDFRTIMETAIDPVWMIKRALPPIPAQLSFNTHRERHLKQQKKRYEESLRDAIATSPGLGHPLGIA